MSCDVMSSAAWLGAAIRSIYHEEFVVAQIHLDFKCGGTKFLKETKSKSECMRTHERTSLPQRQMYIHVTCCACPLLLLRAATFGQKRHSIRNEKM